MSKDIVKPYSDDSGKKEQVQRMFDNIAPRYDLLNHVLSVGIDKLWRKRVAGMVHNNGYRNILDIATGTGDLAIEIVKKSADTNVTGLDLSPQMVEVGKAKVKSAELESKINFIVGDSENICFEDDKFDAVTVGFGVRNFENLQKGISEIYRVIRSGGGVFILEFSMPENKIFASMYKFYFFKILPIIGAIVSKDKSAYEYLPNSVEEFPYGERFCKMLTECGFSNVKSKRLMGGIATIYSGIK